MRKAFLPDQEVRKLNGETVLMELTEEQARETAPWAAVVVRSDGGWWAFESAEDAARWERQK